MTPNTAIEALTKEALELALEYVIDAVNNVPHGADEMLFNTRRDMAKIEAALSTLIVPEEGVGRVPSEPGSREPSPAVSAASGFDPSRDDGPEPYWDYDESECGNCGGEGFVYGCSWDWQCDTYDEGEGTCLCTRPCHVCQPSKPDPDLQQVLAKALGGIGGSTDG